MFVYTVTIPPHKEYAYVQCGVEDQRSLIIEWPELHRLNHFHAAKKDGSVGVPLQTTTYGALCETTSLLMGTAEAHIT